MFMPSLPSFFVFPAFWSFRSAGRNWLLNFALAPGLFTVTCATAANGFPHKHPVYQYCSCTKEWIFWYIIDCWSPRTLGYLCNWLQWGRAWFFFATLAAGTVRIATAFPSHMHSSLHWRSPGHTSRQSHQCRVVNHADVPTGYIIDIMEI